MKKIITLIILCFCGLQLSAGNISRTEVYKTKDGTAITFHFFGHASIAIEVNRKYLYFDPVSQYADYKKLPKANAVFITHSHGDHLDTNAIQALYMPQTIVFCDSVSGKSLTAKHPTIMKPGKKISLMKNIKAEAIPAYNISKGHLQYHPKDRKDCGYLLTIGKSRIYIAGDTENTKEMKALKNIDIAFLPVNQPYTMTVDEAIDAVKAMRPKIFYPYHYGQREGKTDINRLVKETKAYTDTRIRSME